MSLKAIIVLLGLAGLIGIGFGYFLRWIVSLGKKGSVELEIKQMMLDAKEEANRVVEKGEKKGKEEADRLSHDLKEKEETVRKSEDRLIKREELIDKRQSDVDGEAKKIEEKTAEVESLKEQTEGLHSKMQTELENIAKLSTEDAKKELMETVEKEYEEDILVRIQKLEANGRERLEKKAQDILSASIYRLGNAVNTDVLTTTVSIPNDEIKGKIIGKEGRNIKAFERAAGVDVIIDDTPGMITISSFDPARRQIARVALENLILDGRIQPVKIEEAVQKAKDEINKIMKEQGEKAAYEAGVLNLDPRIIAIMGRMHFRTSYGQNVLQHSVEMAHIAAVLAEELGGDVQVARAGAFVHDIGKAVDHEIQGTHVEIGRRILQKFGADPRIIQAMQAHHDEYPFETVESIIVQVADAISGGRPGARRDTVENYIKRLNDLEDIANTHEGVEKSYAIQAGRELRVFVTPNKVTDLQAVEMAKDIANKIEADLKYPGEIKVAVIRESKAVEYAK